MVSEETVLCLGSSWGTSEHVSKPISSPPFLTPQHKRGHANHTEDNDINITFEAILHFQSTLWKCAFFSNRPRLKRIPWLYSMQLSLWVWDDSAGLQISKSKAWTVQEFSILCLPQRSAVKQWRYAVSNPDTGLLEGLVWHSKIYCWNKNVLNLNGCLICHWELQSLSTKKETASEISKKRPGFPFLCYRIKTAALNSKILISAEVQKGN